MLLSIDREKVNALLAKSEPRYTVTASNIVMSNIQNIIENTVHVVSATLEVPADLEKARERLLALRKRVIDSGKAPVSFDGLQSLIDETRGRS